MKEELPNFSQFTIFIPEAKRSIVVGYQCTQDAAKVYPEKCPFLSADELMGAKYDEFILWTKMSIGLIRVSLIALWLAMLLVIDLLICRFVVEASGIKARR